MIEQNASAKTKINVVWMAIKGSKVLEDGGEIQGRMV